MRKSFWSLAISLVTLISVLVPAAGAQHKKRVAVLNFDYATVQTNVSAVFGTNVDVGRGISDLLVQQLVTDGKFSLIERNAIEKIMNEQNFSNAFIMCDPYRVKNKRFRQDVACSSRDHKVIIDTKSLQNPDPENTS